MDLGINIETIRLDRLSDADFKFRYSITADDKVTLTEPFYKTFGCLRDAIDYVRCFTNEVPFCIKCKSCLNESSVIPFPNPTMVKFHCRKCETTFLHPKDT
jgi:hypothetical protein